jgi:rhodanese-related sulfurtransferase
MGAVSRSIMLHPGHVALYRKLKELNTMTVTTAVTAASLVGEAKAQIENLSPAAVAAEMEDGDAVLIDLREAEEREQGSIPGAIHAPRGMLEFYADPASPYHRPEFDLGRRTILACASGGRSALAAATLQRLGYYRVAHLDGGLKAWREAGLPVESGS